MTEQLRDSPRFGWLAVVASWIRTGGLAGCAVALGHVTDAALDGRSVVPSALWAAAFAIVGALAGAVAEGLPGRIQADEEKSWRGRVADAAMAGTLRTEVRPAGPPRGPQPRGAEGVALDAATVGVEKIAGYRATFLAPTFASFTAPLLVLLAWALGVDALSALALAGFVALVPVLIVVASKLLRTSNAEYRRRESAAASRYLEMLEGLGTMKVLGAFPRVWREYSVSARGAMAELGRLLARNQTTIIVNDAVFGLLMAGAAVALVLWRFAAGEVSVGQALAGVLLTVLLVEPIDRMGRTFYVGLAGRARRDQVDAMLAGADAVDAGAGAGADAGSRADAVAASRSVESAEAADAVAERRSDAPAIDVVALEVVLPSRSAAGHPGAGRPGHPSPAQSGASHPGGDQPHGDHPHGGHGDAGHAGRPGAGRAGHPSAAHSGAGPHAAHAGHPHAAHTAHPAPPTPTPPTRPAAPALTDVTLRIPAGARISVVGPSGAGKSTLLRVLAGLLSASAGHIELDGRRASAAELRAATTLVAQSAALLSSTVADNLRLAAPDATDAELRDALRRAHLLDEIEARPGGLDAPVGNAGAQLSGGQRRRLTLARALLRPARMLLLDEATADLDRATEASVRETLREAARGRTVVQVAHRLDTTLDSDLIAVIEAGRITAVGTPAELRAAPGYYRDALAAEEVRA